MRWKLFAMTVGLALLSICTAGVAAAEEKPGWEFEFEPYGWLIGVFGSLTVKGHEAQSNVSSSDVYQLLEDGKAFASAGYMSARYGRWSLFADAFGGYVREGVTEQVPTQLCTLSVAATAKLKFAISDFALGYEVGRWSLPERRRPLTFGVYAGTRYQYFSAKLNASAGVAGGIQQAAHAVNSWGWADPLIGLRWEAPVLDRVSLAFRGDIGGFGASSHLIWGVVSEARYWLPWTPWSVQPWLGAGYKALAFDRRPRGGDRIDLQFRGPEAGMGFVF